jgi:K(+)-stimulated pyrophosphate-energized sodium pump
LIILYLRLLNPVNLDEFSYIFESLAGYGFGASIVALFNRIGAGIYSKSCDISADLVGRIDNIDPDLSAAAMVADNIGDNIGKILGICSDFFCTFCEALCAILIISGSSPTLTQGANFFWPFLIAASGIVICLISSLNAMSNKVSEKRDVQKTLSDQLDYATTIMTVMVIGIAYYGLPETITFNTITINSQGFTLGYTVEKTDILICVLIGLIAGIGIGYNSYYFTAPENPPCQQLAYNCKNGPAINIIQGYSLGFLSCVVPAMIIACIIILI